MICAKLVKNKHIGLHNPKPLIILWLIKLKWYMKKLMILVFLGFFCSCISQKKIYANLNSWVGHYKTELIESWGPPSETTSNGNGGEVLIYSNRTYYTTMGGTVDYWEYKMLYADSRGKIYRWLYKKRPYAPNRVDVRFLIR